MTPIENPTPFDVSPYGDRAAWERRAAAVREQIASALGLSPMPPRPAITARVDGPIERVGYTVWNVSFESVAGHRVSGNLYRPIGDGPFPAVLRPHGHWRGGLGGRLMWADDDRVATELASGAERVEAAARSPLQASCANLAMMGCVVFMYDMVGFADSTQLPHGEGLPGSGLIGPMGLQIWNGLRSLDWLASLPYVDASRIGVAGASSGGLQSVVLAALDDRITATAAVAMIGMHKQGGCACENAERLRDGTSNVEFAATLAPRAIGFASAEDWTADFATLGLPELRRIYGLYNAGGQLEHVHVPFGHNFNVHSREFVYAFFNRHLRLNQPSTAEREFRPVAPEQLRVGS